jgi:hypothetical protein
MSKIDNCDVLVDQCLADIFRGPAFSNRNLKVPTETNVLLFERVEELNSTINIEQLGGQPQVYVVCKYK